MKNFYQVNTTEILEKQIILRLNNLSVGDDWKQRLFMNGESWVIVILQRIGREKIKNNMLVTVGKNTDLNNTD